MKFLDLVERAQLNATGIHPFVFSRDLLNIDENGPVAVPDVPVDADVALPFPKITFEIDGGNITVAHQNDFMPTYIQCIYAEEIGPDRFNFVMLGKVKHGGKDYVVHADIKYGDESVEGAYHSIRNTLLVYLERLYQHKPYIIKNVGKVRYKDKANKKVEYKPKKVIYISPYTKDNSPIRTSGDKTAHPMAGCFVRCHYRRLPNPESMGKDRYGNRTLKGKTFVSNYVKGKTPVFLDKVRKVL